MDNEHPVVVSRHYFRNCRTAFRLLQGALLSGHFNVSSEKRAALKERMIVLEKGVYDKSNPELNKIHSFFNGLDKYAEEAKPLMEGEDAVKLDQQKIIVIDDQYETCGWKEVFELILPAESIIAIKNFNQAEHRINSVKSSVVAVFIDLNMDNDGKSEVKLDGTEGFQLINKLSKNYPQIPIVTFTAYESVILAKKSFEEGSWDYFAKEPTADSSEKYRDPIKYYLKFLEILRKYQAYNKENIQYWNLIDSLEQQMRPKLPSNFTENILKNLRSAYMFLCMKEMIRFRPKIWNINKTEMVIAQSSKALDTFCALLMNQFKIPVFPNEKPTLGFKVIRLKGKLQKNKQYQNWIERVGKGVNLRNESIHETEYSQREKTFVISSSPVDAVGKDYFAKITHILIDGMKFIH